MLQPEKLGNGDRIRKRFVASRQGPLFASLEAATLTIGGQPRGYDSSLHAQR